MLSKPKFLSPSINMQGNTVIDVNSETVPFSCIVDGNEAVTAWQIQIYKLEDNTNVLYDTGKKTISPFYPVNNRNQNVVFIQELDDLQETVVNREEPYYWTISLWGEQDSIEQDPTTCSAEEVFYANSTPEAQMFYSYDSINLHELEGVDTLDRRKVYFKADYIQGESIPLKRYGWRLTDTTNNDVIFDTITHNQIYGIDISCECDGLINKTNYLIELYIETQNGYSAIAEKSFNIDYIVRDAEADIKVSALNNVSGIMLDLGEIKTTEGVISGNESAVKYVDNFPVPNTSSIKIPNDTEVIFQGNANSGDLEIDEESYVVLSFQFDKSQDVTLFSMSGRDENSNEITRELSYTSSDGKLKYIITKGTTSVDPVEATLSNRASEECWYIVKLSPMSSPYDTPTTSMSVVEYHTEGGRYPSDELYPQNNLYPSFGEWNDDPALYTSVGTWNSEQEE